MTKRRTLVACALVIGLAVVLIWTDHKIRFQSEANRKLNLALVNMDSDRIRDALREGADPNIHVDMLDQPQEAGSLWQTVKQFFIPGRTPDQEWSSALPWAIYADMGSESDARELPAVRALLTAGYDVDRKHADGKKALDYMRDFGLKNPEALIQKYARKH